MKWWKNNKKEFKKGLDPEEYTKYEPIIDQLEKLNEITKGASYSEYSEEELIIKIDNIICQVSKVPNSVKIIDDDGTEVVLFDMFDRMISYMKSRISKKWEEELFHLLKTVRLNRGFSQTELSNLSGASTSCISRYEKGERHNIGVDKLKAICDALEIEISWVFNQLSSLYKKSENLTTAADLLLENNYTCENRNEAFELDDKSKLLDFIKEIDRLEVEENNIVSKASEILKIVEDYKRIG